MKCPKCGSDLDTGFNCPKCGRENWQTIYEVKPELSTAEKLLELVEKGYMTIAPTLKYGQKNMREIQMDMQGTIFDSFDDEINKYYKLSKESK